MHLDVTCFAVHSKMSGRELDMVPKTTTTMALGRRSWLLTRLAMVVCGAIIGAAVLVALISTVLRWLNVAPEETPLAVAGGLAGACAMLLALAWSSSSALKQERPDSAWIWMAPDPALMTPMAWTPAPMVFTDSLSPTPPESEQAAVRRQASASPHCSGRRPMRHPPSRRVYRPRRVLPLPPAEA